MSNSKGNTIQPSAHLSNTNTFNFTHYREGKKKLRKVILLAFHEFLSDLLHIYRVYRWGQSNLLGNQKFRILTHKSNIFTKTSIAGSSKMAIFRGMMSKIEFGENWLYGYDLYYGFGSKMVVDDFPKFF